MLKGTFRRATAVLVAVGCVAIVAACGSDDSSDTSSADSGEARLSAGCAADKKITDGLNQLFENTPALQGDKPPTKAQLPQIQANFDKFVAGPLAQIQQNAPAELKADVAKAVASVKQLRATGSPEQLSSPAVQKATSNVDGYYFKNCPGQKAAITGIDYAFDGAKPTYAPGATRIQFVNKGKEEHELVLVKRKPGTTESFDALLELPESQSESKVQFLGQTAGPPGSSNYIATSLTKGDYLMLCSIPKGATPGKEGKGPPHFELGMKKEFAVQ